MPKEFFIEEKIDGERIQLHKRGNEYFYCSRSVSLPTLTEVLRIEHIRRLFRKAKDYTYLYGAHVGEGTLTPYIHGAFSPNVQRSVDSG
jgi:DNA ligase-4